MDTHLHKYSLARRDDFGRGAKEIAENIGTGSIHRLRIEVRRLRAVLWILKHSTPSLRFKKLNRKLKELGQILGEVRELDVAIRDAEELGLDTGDLRDARKKSRRRVKAFLTPVMRKKLARGIEEVCAAIEAAAKLDQHAALFDVRAHLELWRARQVSSGENLHQLRIRFKKTRYVFEALGMRVGWLRKAQQSLGKVHDLEVLQERLGKSDSLARKQAEQTAEALKTIQPTLSFAIHQLDK